MPEVHLPKFAKKLREGATRVGTAAYQSSGHSILGVVLEVLLISVGVFLGLAGEQWRENARHRELAESSLHRFREEIRANRARVVSVAAKHVKEQKDLLAYLAEHNRELAAHFADPRAPLPLPEPETATWPPAFEYSAWDVALATQSLAYMDPDLAAAIAYVYRGQQHYDDNVNAITQTMYSYSNKAVWFRAVFNYVDDCTFIDSLMIKNYDDVLPRINRALGETSVHP